jgi:hypothetical protein
MNQPDPAPNDRPPIFMQVIDDIHARAAVGLKSYGTYLQAGNGRDALADLMAEQLDGACYTRQAIEERDDFMAAVRELVAVVQDYHGLLEISQPLSNSLARVRKMLPPKA